MKPNSKITLTSLLILFVALTCAMAQVTYNAIDLGTLGGPTSTATDVDPSGRVGGFSLAADGSGHAFFYVNGTMSDLGPIGDVGMIDPTTGNQNGALASSPTGQIVGFAAMNDGAIHAFLSTNGQMSDLNEITNLSTGGFQVLRVAKAINDSGLIVGDGIMTTGDRHAFLLVPVSAAAGAPEKPAAIPTKGGQWSYADNQWVWTASDGGWGYSGGSWQWNGSGNPPHHHPQPPPPPPAPIRRTPILTPILGRSPITVYGTPPAPSQPPSWKKTPFLTPGVGTVYGTPNAPTQPPTFNKSPFLTPGVGTVYGTPNAPTQPPTFNKSPTFGKSPITVYGTPNAPSPAPSAGGNNPPVGGTPPPNATPPPSQTPSPSATPKHHRPPTKNATPTPSPHAHKATAAPTVHGPKPSPTQGGQQHEQHHHGH